MSHVLPAGRCLGVLLALALGTSLSALGGAPAFAQQGQTSVPSVHLDIPRQPLSSALQAFSRRTGIQVVYTASIDAGITSPGIRGEFDAMTALSRLLSGTGVAFHQTGKSAVVLTKTSSNITLGPVRVGGIYNVHQGLTEPGAGYIAQDTTVGTKTDTPLVEIPQSISVVTSAQMEMKRDQTLVDALGYAPGMSVAPLGTQNKDTFYIRGFGDSDGGGLQYLDGMKIVYGNGFAQPQIDPSNLERVEVLRGPASALYGQNSPGGMINLVSRMPTENQIYHFNFQAGSYDNYQGTADIGGKIDQQGKFLYRITTLLRTNDTQFRFNQQERFSISPSFTYRIDLKTSLTFLSNYQHDNPGGRFYNLIPAYGSVLNNPNGKIPSTFTDADPSYDKFDRTQYHVGYLFDHEFNQNLRFHQGFRYMNVGAEYKDIFSAGLEPDMRTLERYTRFNEEYLKTITLDNNIQYKTKTGALGHTIIVGFDYRYLSDNNSVGLGEAPSLDLFNPQYGGFSVADPAFYTSTIQTMHQSGIYFQDQMKWKGLNITLSGRQDWADLQTKNRLSGTTTNSSSEKFTWRAGILYEFPQGVAPYFSYATSFYPTTGTDFEGNAFKPTTGTQYEVGVKYKPKIIDALFTVAAFNLTQKNVLTEDPDATHVGYEVQTGAIRSRGVEAEAHVWLNKNLSLIASYTHLDEVVTHSNTSNLGKTPVYIPKDTASLWVDYHFNKGTVRGLVLGGGMRFVGSTFGDTVNSFKVPRYEVFDAAIRYPLGALSQDLGKWSVGINIKNAFDKTYVAGCGNAYGCYYGNRRTVFGNIDYKW